MLVTEAGKQQKGHWPGQMEPDVGQAGRDLRGEDSSRCAGPQIPSWEWGPSTGTWGSLDRRRRDAVRRGRQGDAGLAGEARRAG